MNDLDMIRQIRPDTPVAGPDELGQARGRLIAVIEGERAPGRTAAARNQRAAAGARPRFRSLRWVQVTAVAASVVAVGVSATMLAGSGARSHQPPPAAATRPATRPAASAPAVSRAPSPAQVVLAAKFLAKAARVVLRQEAGRRHRAGPGSLVAGLYGHELELQ
jgi:hypothetical protein